MSSSSKNAMIAKQSLKVIEVPLNKFSEEVIPHHQQAFADYKTLIQEVIVKILLHKSLYLYFF